MADLALAYARAQAASKKQAAWARWVNASTAAGQAAAERDWDAAATELGALPGLISPEAIARLQAEWAAEDA